MSEPKPCRWRSGSGVALVCSSPKYVGTPRPVTAAFCSQQCYYPDHAPEPAGRRPLPLSCQHRGEPTGEVRPCLTCTGTVQVPVLTCSLHQGCTLDRLVAGLACCLICRDRLA